MAPWIEYLTTNGHRVLLDREDWEALEPLLDAGLRLQSIATRGTVVVLLREYAPPRTMVLSRALLGAASREDIQHLNADRLDCRRANLRAFQTCRRIDWASLTKRQIEST